MSDAIPSLVVRRLPPFPLVSVAAPFPRADVIPYCPDHPGPKPTTAAADTRAEAETLLAAGVQLVRVSGVKAADELTALLAGLPPERLALEFDRDVGEGDVPFAAGISVGTVMVPTPVTDLAALAVLKALPVERRLAVRVRPSPDMIEEVMRAIELFGVDRLIFWTDSADAGELAALADAGRHIRKLFGIPQQAEEITYGGDLS